MANEKQIPECRAQWERGPEIFEARPCPLVFPELPKAFSNGPRFSLNGQARSDTGSTGASNSRPAYEGAALLWHGKSLWCQQCFASQIAAADRMPEI
jgi:hypothetical protein